MKFAFIIAALSLGLQAQTGSPLIVADTTGSPGSGTQVNQSIAIINGKMYFSDSYASGTNYSQGNMVVSGNYTYVSLTNGNQGNTPGISAAWRQLPTGVLAIATGTTLGGAIFPSANGWAIDGFGNVSMTKAGLLAIIGGAGVPNANILYPYVTINSTQVPLGGSFTTPTIPTQASQINNAVDSTQVYSNPGWIGTLAWSKLTGVPTFANSFNGRVGPIVSATGDYSASQVTNAVDNTGSYSNPNWITGLAWSKVLSAPAFITGSQVVSNIGAGAIANNQLANNSITVNGVTCSLGAGCTIATGSGGGYTLPAATTTALGGLLVPSSGGLTVDGSGNLSITQAAIISKLGFTPQNAASANSNNEPLISYPGTAPAAKAYFGDKNFKTLDTSIVPENGALYFTNLRAQSAITATHIDTTIQAQTGCSTAGYVWVPASNTCVAQSGGAPSGTPNKVLATDPSGSSTSAAILRALTIADMPAGAVLTTPTAGSGSAIYNGDTNTISFAGAFTFTAAGSRTITASQHGMSTIALAVFCYDTSVSPAVQFLPASVSVDQSTFQVVATFSANKTGYCTVK